MALTLETVRARYHIDAKGRAGARSPVFCVRATPELREAKHG